MTHPARRPPPALRLGLATVGREIARAAIYAETVRVQPKDGHGPTPERLRHGQTVERYTATDAAGEIGHRVVDACLLDALKEGGLLNDPGSKTIEPAVRRHSAGISLWTLFHESGLMRSVTALLTSTGGTGSQDRPAAYEASNHASRSLAMYLSAIRQVETSIIEGDTKARVTSGARRRAAHAVREIACWDRWPTGYTAAEVRAAFDRLAAVDGVEVEE